MKKALMPVLAAVLFAGACDAGDPTTAAPGARVRFFNAVGMVGGFTTNGQFVTGSAIPFGQHMQTCSTVGAGSTSFGFGVANTGGTGLIGSAAATLDNKSLTDGGNYTVAAAGFPQSAKTLYLIDNNFSGSLGANQAAVRFVNLSPSAELNFDVHTGPGGSASTLIARSIARGSPTTFNTVTSGSNEFTITIDDFVVVSGSAGMINLQAGSINTLAIVGNATSHTFHLANIPRC